MITTSHYRTSDAVLAVLTGTPVPQAAAGAGLDPDDLTDAVDVYRAAGDAALHARTTHSWHQVRVTFTDWAHAETIAAGHLAPALQQLHDGGFITGWWFIRKHPCWRIRCQSTPTTSHTTLHAIISTLLNRLIEQGLVDRWRPSIYEPEVPAFGGPIGIDIAHQLFHADSVGVLDYLRRHIGTDPAIGRRELAVLLCTALFRGAGQEWHEQGDVWHRVTDLRPLPHDISPDRLDNMGTTVRRLLAADTATDGGLFRDETMVAFARPWVTGFIAAGAALHAAAQQGTLRRGLRDVLAHHVIFHFNRFGVIDRHQAILARAAYDTVMNPPTQIHQ